MNEYDLGLVPTCKASPQKHVKNIREHYSEQKKELERQIKKDKIKELSPKSSNKKSEPRTNIRSLGGKDPPVVQLLEEFQPGVNVPTAWADLLNYQMAPIESEARQFWNMDLNNESKYPEGIDWASLAARNSFKS